ncbi:mechanosensitive ion channel family protein [Sandaracinobacteroides saxicola]|uniref:Mechanosensitive ion channel n=1 Tax=Sandaracinobacteroides saxicola TaxID=2759707 RepID=A0A7G5IL42_9SPHN|nr:mechanosensitive ion channel domain-containing protein [Sandaracinobacteroides saxicola]QMW24084.1 mechanosensitive ion channel [Sandaracinobacteroides saxicola]
MTANPNHLTLDQMNADLLALPEQARTLSEQLVQWLRTDSLQALIGVAVGTALYFALVGVRELLKRWLGRDAPRGSWRWVALRVTSRTRSFFLATGSAQAVSALAAPPGAWLAIITFLFTVAGAVQAAFWLRELLVCLVERRAMEADEQDSGLFSALGVIRVLITIAVWVVAFILLLDNLGVNVTALVAGLGIGGIAIGLAAQGIFADLFAALSILLDRPFKRGDTISFGAPNATTTGTVESIGLKTTRLRGAAGEEVVVSNTKLLADQIRNVARIEARTVTMALVLDSDSSVAALTAVRDELKAAVEAVDGAEFVRANIHNATLNGLEVELTFTLSDPGYANMMAARQSILLAALAAFSAAGLHLARPR